MRVDRWRKISLLTKLITIIFHLLSAGLGCWHVEVPQLYLWISVSGGMEPSQRDWEEDAQHKPRPLHLTEGRGKEMGEFRSGVLSSLRVCPQTALAQI